MNASWRKLQIVDIGRVEKYYPKIVLIVWNIIFNISTFANISAVMIPRMIDQVLQINITIHTTNCFTRIKNTARFLKTTISALQSKNYGMCISDCMQATFFYLGRFLKKLVCFLITKGSIYYIKHMFIQLFTMGVDWPEIWHLMDISTMFYICRYCIFT